MIRLVLGLATCCAGFVPARATAQENLPWPDRIFVAIDVPFQLLNNDFSESLRFADATARTENVTFTSRYEPIRGVLFDAGAGVRAAKSLGVGATVSWFRRSSSGSFDLAVPNPLVANRPLELAGSISGLNRNEVGVHIQALYAVPLGKRARLMAAAGPSIFHTKQDLVRSIEFERVPGFAGLKFERALTGSVERTVAGFNVGADITWPFASHVGVGAIVRYSRAKATLDPGSESGVSRAIEMFAGGLHLGGGIRLLF